MREARVNLSLDSRSGGELFRLEVVQFKPNYEINTRSGVSEPLGSFQLHVSNNKIDHVFDVPLDPAAS